MARKRNDAFWVCNKIVFWISHPDSENCPKKIPKINTIAFVPSLFLCFYFSAYISVYITRFKNHITQFFFLFHSNFYSPFSQHFDWGCLLNSISIFAGCKPASVKFMTSEILQHNCHIITQAQGRKESYFQKRTELTQSSEVAGYILYRFTVRKT